MAAALNAPLTSTDRLLTGEGSRAEIQFDAANMIRLAPSTEVRLGDLAYHQYQVQIAAGTTLFRVMRDNDAQIEISTPSIAVRPLKRGVYRITVKADGSTEVTVRSGDAEIASPKGTEKLGAGKTMEARGSADNPEFQVTAAIAQDQFDKWNLDRDQDLEKSTSGRYVNPDINGTEELDANGRWVNDPAYGQVWVPTVDPGWAPYQVGRWVWSIIMAGPGSAPIPGVGLLITTVAGIRARMAGRGGRVLCTVPIIGGRLWSDSSAGAGPASASGLAWDSATSAGWRWLRLSASAPGTALEFTATASARLL